MIKINGKRYPLWSQFVEQKGKWIGGVLQDFGDSMDKALGLANGAMETIITDITLEPNGDDSAFFSVKGEKFGCGFDVGHGRIGDCQEKPWLTFSGYGGHKWRIKKALPRGRL